MDFKNNMSNSVRTKQQSVLTVFFAFFLSIISYAQEPPPSFKIKLSDLMTSNDSVMENYEFTTFVFRDSMQREKGNSSKWEKGRLIKEIDSQFISVYIYGEQIHLPKKGDVIRLTINKKGTNNQMDLFIRISGDLDYGDQLEINHLMFEPGQLFFDLCKSKPKYEISSDFALEKTLNLSKFKLHKISDKEINKLLNTCKC